MSFMYTISLDTKQYDHQTKRLEFPLLAVPTAKVEHLYINGEELTRGQFNAGKNYLKINSGIDDKSEIKAILSFRHRDFLTRFWLPIIVAVITSIAGLLSVFFPNGNFFQPVQVAQADLPNAEILHWTYCPNLHEFRTAISFGDINKELANGERFWVAIRTKDKSIDPMQDNVDRINQKYTFHVGPFELESKLIVVPASQEFTSVAESDDKVVEVVFFSGKPQIVLPPVFSPADFTDKISVRFHKWDGKKQCVYG